MKAPKDVITYGTVISAWSASGMQSHAVVRAEELLREMEETPGLELNNIVLNSIMSAWVKSKNPATVNRTTELLEYMEYSNHAPADLITYNTHLHALSIHSHRVPGYAQRANDLLASLEAKYERGEIMFRPNLFSYNVVIEALCRSQSPEAAWDAVKLLRSFISSDSKYQIHFHSIKCFRLSLEAKKRDLRNSQNTCWITWRLLTKMEFFEKRRPTLCLTPLS
jgi:pentatricopeptide repeat protein